MKVPNGIDFVGTEVKNARIHNLGAAPASPLAGQFWYNTGDGMVYYRNNTINVAICTLAQLAATSLSGLAAPTADLSLAGFKLTNVANGTGANDAVNVSQLTAAIQGLKWKDVVRVSTTSAITLSGLQTIDGVSVAAGDRVAKMDGSATAGIYTAASGAWTRATDADTAAEVLGMSFFVSEGTANGNKVFVMTTDAPITLGTTVLVFAQIGGGGTTYTAGTGISISGNAIAVDTTIVARKAVATIGDGSATTITVNHTLNTQAVHVSIRELSTNALWLADVIANTTTSIQLLFSTAPTSNQFEVTIIA